MCLVASIHNILVQNMLLFQLFLVPLLKFLLFFAASIHEEPVRIFDEICTF